MKHLLPKLNYNFDDLEPYIDSKTMEIHYSKHHQAYIDKLNTLIDKNPSLSKSPVEELLTNISSFELDPADRQTLINHGGGHANHNFFWSIMGPKKQTDLMLVNKIKTQYNSITEFKQKFENAALSHFGSGWIWLVEKKDSKLEIYSTPNQNSPLLVGDKPLITLDVWEHAYYLKYQNRRAEYVKNWWNTLILLP